VDEDGYVYVAESPPDPEDYPKLRIQKFDANGTYLTHWYVKNDTSDLAVGNGYVYVTESGSNKILKFYSNGTFTLTFKETQISL
jgi:hypothetical protein